MSSNVSSKCTVHNCFQLVLVCWNFSKNEKKTTCAFYWFHCLIRCLLSRKLIHVVYYVILWRKDLLLIVSEVNSWSDWLKDKMVVKTDCYHINPVLCLFVVVFFSFKKKTTVRLHWINCIYIVLYFQLNSFYTDIFQQKCFCFLLRNILQLHSHLNIRPYVHNWDWDQIFFAIFFSQNFNSSTIGYKTMLKNDHLWLVIKLIFGWLQTFQINKKNKFHSQIQLKCKQKSEHEFWKSRENRVWLQNTGKKNKKKQSSNPLE